MVKYNYETYLIFVICVFIQRKHGFAHGSVEENEERFSIEKCAYNGCSCADFHEIPGISCGSDRLTVTDVEYLPARLFKKLSLTSLEVDDPKMAANENVFIEMTSLTYFEVKRSNITVFFIFYACIEV